MARLFVSALLISAAIGCGVSASNVSPASHPGPSRAEVQTPARSFDTGQPAGSSSAEAAIVSSEIHRILGNLRQGKYSHVTRVDEQAGRYEVDCSGLVCYVLERVLPAHYKSLQQAIRATRLTASNYQNAFASMPEDAAGRNGWRQITRPVDVRPGDIIAWRAQTPKPGATGHVVVAVGLPAATAPGVVCVPVVDSTPRRQWDTEDAKGQSGLGHRLLWLSADSKGRLDGFRMSPVGDFDRMPVSIGRPVALPEKARTATAAGAENSAPQTQEPAPRAKAH